MESHGAVSAKRKAPFPIGGSTVHFLVNIHYENIENLLQLQNKQTKKN
uniref:Uncharacterized protein n=1 Tax=Anguilla anguilla TaxID=7936 RepID=A0A0E9TGU4_ANGAN